MSLSDIWSFVSSFQERGSAMVSALTSGVNDPFPLW